MFAYVPLPVPPSMHFHVILLVYGINEISSLLQEIYGHCTYGKIVLPASENGVMETGTNTV